MDDYVPFRSRLTTNRSTFDESLRCSSCPGWESSRTILRYRRCRLRFPSFRTASDCFSGIGNLFWRFRSRLRSWRYHFLCVPFGGRGWVFWSCCWARFGRVALSWRGCRGTFRWILLQGSVAGAWRASCRNWCWFLESCNGKRKFSQRFSSNFSILEAWKNCTFGDF